MTAQTTQKHLSSLLHDKVNDAFTGVAEKRSSYMSKRNSALIREEAEGNPDLEQHLRNENEDVINPLPRAHVVQTNKAGNFSFPHSPGSPKGQRDLAADIKAALEAGNAGGVLDPSVLEEKEYDFGFPSTPTEFQKNLMRFAFLPAAARSADGWTTQYGRPDLPYQLRELSKTWTGRTCIFVCGPPGMRLTVAKQVAELQKLVFTDRTKEEIFLHTENYAL
jgi:hypothetical protein